MGSMVGTGVFVSIGIAAGVTGPSVIFAIFAAALVALFNGLSSAQLAAAHPVSGGTYEYGCRFLNPTAGFTAGWVFLLAKSSSAATAAIGFSGYLSNLLGTGPARNLIAVLTVAAICLTVSLGVKISSRINFVIVGFVMLVLGIFIIFAFSAGTESLAERFTRPFASVEGKSSGGIAGFLEAAALMFVAFTGFGRVATLGEEVKEPRATIPRAIIVTIAAVLVLYILVAVAALCRVDAAGYYAFTVGEAAPLELIARGFSRPWVAVAVAAAAMMAMLGVLLNLVLGLSRTVLAMARRQDLPAVFARIPQRFSSPIAAVALVGVVIALMAFFGSVKVNWSFSAFTVLVYYLLTNLSALRLNEAQRFAPRWVSVAGACCCLSLALFIETAYIAAGCMMIIAGLSVRLLFRKIIR